jgi:Natural resistance-associated macrophage protein
MTEVALVEQKNLLRRLGPGLITGAADDDPSGIATYSQVGAQFGFAMLWTALFSFPLMAAIQEICARLGRITGRGIAEKPSSLLPEIRALFARFAPLFSEHFQFGNRCDGNGRSRSIGFRRLGQCLRICFRGSVSFAAGLRPL